MRIANGEVYERFRADPSILDCWVACDAAIFIVTDDAVTPIIMSAAGRGYIPANTRWIQLAWPIPDGP